MGRMTCSFIREATIVYVVCHILEMISRITCSFIREARITTEYALENLNEVNTCKLNIPKEINMVQ